MRAFGVVGVLFLLVALGGAGRARGENLEFFESVLAGGIATGPAPMLDPRARPASGLDEVLGGLVDLVLEYQQKYCPPPAETVDMLPLGSSPILGGYSGPLIPQPGGRIGLTPYGLYLQTHKRLRRVLAFLKWLRTSHPELGGRRVHDDTLKGAFECFAANDPRVGPSGSEDDGLASFAAAFGLVSVFGGGTSAQQLEVAEMSSAFTLLVVEFAYPELREQLGKLHEQNLAELRAAAAKAEAAPAEPEDEPDAEPDVDPSELDGAEDMVEPLAPLGFGEPEAPGDALEDGLPMRDGGGY